MIMKHNNSKLMGCSKSNSREVYSNTIIPQETKKTSNRQAKFTPKATIKTEFKKPQSQKKERNHKNQNRNK